VVFLLLTTPAAALAQAAGDGLPLVWVWLAAGLILVAALAWLLFGGGVRHRRQLPHERPPRP
jgi:hypothetical protein